MPRASGKFDDESFPFYLKFSLRNEIVKINSIRSLFSFAATHTPKRLLKFVNRHFCMFFLIYAYKDILDISFQSKLIYTGDPRASFCKISGGHSMDSKINYFLLKGDKPFSVVKFPRNKKSTLLASEESRLSQFNHIEVKKGVIDSVPIFTEPMLKGTNLRPNSWVHNQKALKWLFNFQNKTMKQFWDYNQFERKVRDFQDVLLSIDVNKLVRQRTEENIDRFLRSLKYTKLPVTSEQGDYYSENILSIMMVFM